MPQVSRGTLTSAGPHGREEAAGKKPAEPEAVPGQRPSMAMPSGEGLGEGRAFGEGGEEPILEREHEHVHEEGEEEEDGVDGAEGEAGAEAEAEAGVEGEYGFVRERELGQGHGGAGARHRHRRRSDTALALGDDLMADFDFDADPGMCILTQSPTHIQTNECSQLLLP